MSATCLKPPSVKSQCGFLLVTAIFLLVILAALGAFILTISGTQQTSSALDVQGSRAYQAARAGIEWASDQLLISTVGTIAFRSADKNWGSSVSSLTINKPAGTVQNDVMIAAIGVHPNTEIVTPPAGWTLVRRMDNANPNANSLVVYLLVAGGSEPANYQWTFNTSTGAAGGIQTFSGVDTTTPINVENGQCTLAGSCATLTFSHATPSVTTTVANTMVVTAHALYSAANWTPPAGMTEGFDTGNFGTHSTEGNWVAQAAAGATGIKTATSDNSGGGADVGNAHILALQPGPTPTTFATNCNAGSTSQNVTGMGGTLSGFTAAVTCSNTTYTEGSATWTVYQITSTGAQGTAGTLDRVERQLQVTLIK